MACCNTFEWNDLVLKIIPCRWRTRSWHFVYCPFRYTVIQGVPRLVIQKSTVVTSELGEVIWSGTFQKLRIVLKFSFNTSPPTDVIPLVQSVLEFLPIIMESYTVTERVQCCLLFRESQSPTCIQRKFWTTYHKNNHSKEWLF